MTDNLMLPPNHSRAMVLDRIYRRISQLDDASLAGLDVLLTEADAFTLDDEPPVNVAKAGSTGRRAFILAMLTGGVALAAGGTLKVIELESVQTSSTLIDTPTTAAPASEAVLHEPAPNIEAAAPSQDMLINDMQRELANLQSERIAIRAELDTAYSDAATTQTNIANLSAELDARNRDVAYLQQIVTLFEQLDATGLDDIIAAGLSPVALALFAMDSGRSLLNSGIEEAARLLATVEVQSPLLANGLIWLENQVAYLSQTLQQLEDALSTIVEPVAPVTQQIGDFIGKVVDLLPFGVGQNIRSGLEAAGAILTHIPELIASINPQIITPLRQWVSPDDSTGLVKDVVHPISENLISPAQSMVTQTTSLDTTFHEQLKTPVEVTLAQRAEIRSQINALTGGNL